MAVLGSPSLDSDHSKYPFPNHTVALETPAAARQAFNNSKMKLPGSLEIPEEGYPLPKEDDNTHHLILFYETVH